MTTITIPAEYGYTIAVAAASSLLVFVFGAKVGSYRSVAKVPLPNMYADDIEAKKDKTKMIFNCKQRVHQNTLETFTMYMTTLLITGLRYPIAAPALGLVWIFGRMAYSYGYTSGDPKKRSLGAMGSLSLLALLGLTGKIAFDLIMSS